MLKCTACKPRSQLVCALATGASTPCRLGRRFSHEKIGGVDKLPKTGGGCLRETVVAAVLKFITAKKSVRTAIQSSD